MTHSKPAATCKVIDIYARISVDYDGTTRSVDSQIEDALDVIDEHPEWSLGEVWKDPFKSAWNPKVVRPDWERMMQRLESGESHGFIVYDLTRFTRKPIEGERLLALAARGILVLSLTTSYNLQTADGRKQFRDAMTAAAFESDKISERSSRGKRKKARKGRSNASNRGYAMDGFLPTPEGWEPGDPRERVPADQLAHEREIVREMAARLLRGETLASISRDMLARGETCIGGGPWTGTSIKQVLRRPSLAGFVVYRDEIVKGAPMLPGEHALDVETWGALESMWAARRRGRPAERYLLSRIARCGRCGAHLYGRPMRSRKPYPDGSVYRQYLCQPVAGHPQGGCGRLTIDQRFADEVVKEATIRRLSDPRHAAQVASRIARVDAARAPLVARIADLERDAVAIAGKAGEWSFDRIDAATRAIDAQLARVRAELDALDDPDAPLPDGDIAAEWERAEQDGNNAALRALVAQAFPRLTIRPATSRGKAALTADRFDWTGDSLPA